MSVRAYLFQSLLHRSSGFIWRLWILSCQETTYINKAALSARERRARENSTFFSKGWLKIKFMFKGMNYRCGWRDRIKTPPLIKQPLLLSLILQSLATAGKRSHVHEHAREGPDSILLNNANVSKALCSEPGKVWNEGVVGWMIIIIIS